MFEIRIVCAPADTYRITTALNGTFTTGTVRQLPSRHTDNTRLYVTADHRPPRDWPTPVEAYALAPSINSEIGWTAEEAVGRPTFALLGREFWLRKAALLDRLALQDESECIHADACALARQAGRRVMDIDEADSTCDVRAYVRQQYAQWAKNQ